MLIVGKSASSGDCIREAREEQAHILVARDGLEEEGSCLDLLLARSPLGVLVVSPDGHSASGVSLARQPMALGSGAPVLAGAIRKLAAELGAVSAAHGAEGALPGKEEG